MSRNSSVQVSWSCMAFHPRYREKTRGQESLDRQYVWLCRYPTMNERTPKRHTNFGAQSIYRICLPLLEEKMNSNGTSAEESPILVRTISICRYGTWIWARHFTLGLSTNYMEEPWWRSTLAFIGDQQCMTKYDSKYFPIRYGYKIWWKYLLLYGRFITALYKSLNIPSLLHG